MDINGGCTISAMLLVLQASTQLAAPSPTLDLWFRQSSATTPLSLIKSPSIKATIQKRYTKRSLEDIMSEGESVGPKPAAKRKRAMAIHRRLQYISQKVARSLKTHLTNMSSA
ncbi:unnamed protein product [Lota lota]